MTSKLQLIESNLDIEKLISEVQNRPAIWDMTQKEYSDRIKRKKCWEEITELFGSDLTSEEKNKLGDILHKKWKNIRDRYTRDSQERKGKSGDGSCKKMPYIYSRQLEFLRDTVTPKRTICSLESRITESTSVQEEREEEDRENDADLQGATSTSLTGSSAPKASRARITQMGKKRLHPVEEQILRSLDRCENRAKMDKEKENVENNDHRHFLLSLVPSLEALPRFLNSKCRIEIMQCINKYETMSQQYQHTSTTYLPTNQSNPGLQQNQLQPQPHQFQPSHHTQMYIPSQLQSSSYNTNQMQFESQYPPSTFRTPMPTPSPAESAASYISNLTDEYDSQFDNL